MVKIDRERLLIAVAGIALFTTLLAIGLHEYLYTFDPYGWAVPGIESDVSRSLFLQRAHLYRLVAILSFTIAMLSMVVALLNRRRKLP